MGRPWKVSAGAGWLCVLLLAPMSAAQDDGVRRDPEGKTGISPYREMVAEGEKAYVAGDYQSAKRSFEEASVEQPAKSLAFLRLGEAALALEDMPAAKAAWDKAKGLQDDKAIAAKALFCLADLAERQADWPTAEQGWNAYADYLRQNPDAGGHPATAEARLKAIRQRIQDEKDYAEVRKRIEEREKELEK